MNTYTHTQREIASIAHKCVNSAYCVCCVCVCAAHFVFACIRLVLLERGGQIALVTMAEMPTALLTIQRFPMEAETEVQ